MGWRYCGRVTRNEDIISFETNKMINKKEVSKYMITCFLGEMNVIMGKNNSTIMFRN